VVDDEDAGIPEAEIARVLQPFARGATSGRRGTGLGLALVDHVARVHRGTLILGRSAMGGLEVRFALPRWTATSADLKSA
jgi:signal transduction histidine kinase